MEATNILGRRTPNSAEKKRLGANSSIKTMKLTKLASCGMTNAEIILTNSTGNSDKPINTGVKY